MSVIWKMRPRRLATRAGRASRVPRLLSVRFRAKPGTMVVFQVPNRQFGLFTVVSLQITDNPKIPVPCLVAIDLFQGSELGAVHLSSAHQ